MCMRIYFVDKEIAQHCKVSVTCKMWLVLRQVETKVRNLTVGFDQSHYLVTGCPSMM